MRHLRCRADIGTQEHSFFPIRGNDVAKRAARLSAEGRFLPTALLAGERNRGRSWQAGGIGLAILCEDLLRLASAIFEQHTAPSRPKKRTIVLRTEPTTATIGAPCIFCEENATRESCWIEVLEELLGELPFRRALENECLCLAHSQVAATSWKNEENRMWIASAVRMHTVVLAEEIRKFIDKHDYQSRGELAGVDDNVVRRAIRMLVGSDRRLSIDETDQP
jgi:hypothetical protein